MICPFCPAVNENGKDRKHQRITVDVLSELRISPSLFEPFLGFLDRSRSCTTLVTQQGVAVANNRKRRPTHPGEILREDVHLLQD